MISDLQAISSERLDLTTLSPELLRLSLARDEPSVERLLGLSVPQDWYKEEGIIRFRLDQVAEDPSYLPGSLRAMALRDKRLMVGYINCHTKPGHPYLKAHSPTGVEFGFEVFAAYRRHGYAREACNALMNWANQQHNISEFILSISPDNLPSLQLAGSLGFEQVGSHIDEKDGLEYIFKLNHRPTDAATEAGSRGLQLRGW